MLAPIEDPLLQNHFMVGGGGGGGNNISISGFLKGPLIILERVNQEAFKDFFNRHCFKNQFPNMPPLPFCLTQSRSQQCDGEKWTWRGCSSARVSLWTWGGSYRFMLNEMHDSS